MIKVFGKSLSDLFHHERPFIGDSADESRIFLLLQYQAGFIPDSEWVEMLAHDPELSMMFHGPDTMH